MPVQTSLSRAQISRILLASWGTATLAAFAIADLGATPQRARAIAIDSTPRATSSERGLRDAAPTDRGLAVDVDPTELDNRDPSVATIRGATVDALRAGDVLALPTAGGDLLRMRVARVTTDLRGTRIVRFRGEPGLGSPADAEAVLTTREGLVGGFVRPRDGFEVALAAVSDGLQNVLLRAAGDGDCGGVVSGDTTKDGADEGGVAEDCQESGKYVDVAYIASDDAAAVWGGFDALSLQITAAVDDANLALGNTGLPTELRLIAIETYTDDVDNVVFSSMGEMFATISNPAAPGPNDELQAWIETRGMRELYSVDLVQMVVDFNSPAACGIGNLFTGDDDEAYSIVDASCLGDYVPAHEFGHNFGACHAVGDGGGCDGGGYFPYSNGYRFTGNSGDLWRTVMAYAPGSRIPFFSTPKKQFDGQPVGVGGQTVAAADNGRTIGLTAPSVANFRCTLVGAIDCNVNGVPDPLDISLGTSQDCNGNAVPDECDIASGFLADGDLNGIPDACEASSEAFKLVSPDLAGEPVMLDAFGFSMSVGHRLDQQFDAAAYMLVGAHGDDQLAQNGGAAYILDPIMAAGTITKIGPADPQPNASFGRSVSAFRRIAQAAPAAPERDFAAVGAYRMPNGGNAEQGAVYVFADDSGWDQVNKLTAADGKPNEWFGFSVAMTRIGGDTFDTLVVGAPRSARNRGAVYIYRYNANDTTTLSKKLLIPFGGNGDQFGWSVAVDNLVGTDRAVLLAGAPGYGLDTGRVRAFERSIVGGVGFPSAGATLLLDSAIAAPGDRFGEALAIEGNIAIIGAPGRDDGEGAVYYFERIAAATWVERQKLTLPGGNEGDRYGSAVAIYRSDDGDIILMASAPKADSLTPAGPQANLGVVTGHIYNPTLNEFELFAVGVTLDGQSGDEAGTSLALFKTSAAPAPLRGAIGVPFDDDGGLNAGSIETAPFDADLGP